MRELQRASRTMCGLTREAGALSLTMDENTPPALWRTVEAAAVSRVPALSTLRELRFRREFNPDAGVLSFATHKVGQMHLRHRFNKSLVGVVWPASVRDVRLGYYFNQPVTGAVWPNGLRTLSFGHKFNQTLEGANLPESLVELKLGKEYNTQLFAAGVRWPSSLRVLHMGADYDQALAGAVWPAGLRELRFGHNFNQPIDGVAAWAHPAWR